MKTIEKECIEFCEKLNSVYDEKQVFKAGVEFAQQWIDVKYELPKRGCSYFNDSDTVLIKVRIKNGTVKILTGHYDLSMKNWYIDAAHYNGIVIAWRPIEYK